MRSLNDVLSDLNTSMDGMTAAEKSNTISEAEARSMPPAAARLRTVGSVSHISWVS